MKKFINKVNKYLIENHPIIWNTKLVWLVGSALIIHIIFFLFGLVTLTNPEILHDRGAKYIFFENGTIFFSIMVSIVLLVVWLVYLFKNNAFKNYYPTSAFKLFKQFLIYFTIVFSCTTFYYSYNFGLKTYITNKYPDAEIKENVLTANKAAPFFSQKIKNYTIDNLKYPEPFSHLYCETNDNKIEYDKVYYQFLNNEYQFYSLIKISRKLGDPYYNKRNRDYIFYTKTDSILNYYYKDSVVNVTAALKSTEPSYYNYSKVFYNNYSKNNNSSYYALDFDYEDYDRLREEKTLEKKIQKENQALLDRNNPDEIKTVLENFLKVADKFKVDHNLTSDYWKSLIYNPNDFKIKALIKDENTQYNSIRNRTNLTETEELYLKLITDSYLESDNLKLAFENIDEIKEATILDETIHVFLWIAFAIALLIFMFRITGLKPLLFSIISAIVLIIFISLIVALVSFTGNSSGFRMEYFVSYLIFFIMTFIIIIALFFSTKIKKIIGAIFINLTLFGFVSYLLLILSIITMHQDRRCRDLYPDYKERQQYCTTILEELGLWWSPILFIAGLVFVYFFSKTIMKWRAMPEG